jgi:hypothetical protein
MHKAREAAQSTNSMHNAREAPRAWLNQSGRGSLLVVIPAGGLPGWRIIPAGGQGRKKETAA